MYIVHFLFYIIYDKTHYKLREIEIIVYIEILFTISSGGPRGSETIEISAFFTIDSVILQARYGQ